MHSLDVAFEYHLLIYGVPVKNAFRLKVHYVGILSRYFNFEIIPPRIIGSQVGTQQMRSGQPLPFS